VGQLSRIPTAGELVEAVLCAVFFLVVAATTAGASALAGIPRDLARQRAAEISNVRYHLTFTLIPHADTASGSEELSFELRAPQGVLLDFRDGAVSTLAVNGAAVDLRSENGHLELPAERLRAGQNTVRAQFTAPVAPAGKAITRYEDHDDNTEYLYTLFVPMDASMAFPCFDQPDLKARFGLELIAPASWTVISNTAAESESNQGAEDRRTVFHETLPISTYLFAFAAGPFHRLNGPPRLPGLYVRASRLEQAKREAPEVQQIAAEGIRYLSSYFARPFPFPKYDIVLIPELAYGGMEHARATFLREQSVIFRTAPTRTDRLNRDILVLHELTHQWFGNLVTMRWFDDLWLKEGFAQYLAYQTLASLRPDENVWKRFYESIKPAAYEIDSTKGTTPDLSGHSGSEGCQVRLRRYRLLQSAGGAEAVCLRARLGELSQWPAGLRQGSRLLERRVERSCPCPRRGLGQEPWSLGGNVDPAPWHAASRRCMVLRRRPLAAIVAFTA
jgi:aminopeptidase N